MDFRPPELVLRFSFMILLPMEHLFNEQEEYEN